MKVSLLYFEGCPNWLVAQARLQEALRQSGHGGQNVELIRIATDEAAQHARFPGSPTILIDGRDPFDSGDPTRFGLTCRVYPGPQGLQGSPTVEQLVAVLRAWA